MDNLIVVSSVPQEGIILVPTKTIDASLVVHNEPTVHVQKATYTEPGVVTLQEIEDYSDTYASTLIEEHNDSTDAHSALLADMLQNASYNPTTGILTFTRKDNTTITIDLPLELIIESGSYDPDAKEIILVLANGDEITIPVTDLVNEYYGDDVTIEQFSDSGKLTFRLTTTYKDLIDNAVPNTRTINGKQLNADIELVSEDISFNGSNVEEVILGLMAGKQDKTETRTIYGSAYATEPAYLTRDNTAFTSGTVITALTSGVEAVVFRNYFVYDADTTIQAGTSVNLQAYFSRNGSAMPTRTTKLQLRVCKFMGDPTSETDRNNTALYDPVAIGEITEEVLLGVYSGISTVVTETKEFATGDILCCTIRATSSANYELTVTVSEDYPFALIRSAVPAVLTNGQIPNVSEVEGATTADALNTLNAEKLSSVETSGAITGDGTSANPIRLSDSYQSAVKVQFTEADTAVAYPNRVMQYVGEETGTEKPNYFYKSTLVGEDYVWVEIPVQAVTDTASEGSTTAITSGGVYAIIGNKQNKIIGSQLLTLTTAGWVGDEQVVAVELNTTHRNEIDVIASSVKEWAKSQVLAVTETETGITFTCETVPTTNLEFKVVSTEVEYAS